MKKKAPFPKEMKEEPSVPKEVLMKVIVMGDTKAGKTSLLLRYVHDIFSEMHKTTVGVDFKLKTLLIPPPPATPTTCMRMQLWDIAGNAATGPMMKTYCKSSGAGLVVFDLVTCGPDSDSLDGFNNVEQWLKRLRESAPSDCILFLTGTHLDEYLSRPQYKTQEDRDIALQKLHALVREALLVWGFDAVPFFAVSAKDGTYVNELMQDICDKYLARSIVPTRKVHVQASQWGLQNTLVLEVPIEKAEAGATGLDVVKAGSVAAAFVKVHKPATQNDVIVARSKANGRGGGADTSQRGARSLPLRHAAETELPPSTDDPTVLFQLMRRQPLTAGLYCELYDPVAKDVLKVILKEADDGGGGRKLTGRAGSTYVTLDEDAPRWLPINAAKRLGLRYRSSEDSERTWECFLGESDSRAAPISCFSVIETLSDLVSACRAAATVA